MFLNSKEKFIIWFVISCIGSVIGGIIGGMIIPEWIGWGALIGFFIPTVLLRIIQGH